MSCASKSKVKRISTHYRFSEIGETRIKVTPLVVDLCIDFDKIVSGKSKTCLTEQEAIDGARYDALISSKDENLAVLVSPIYFVTREETVKRRKSTFNFTCEVMAFSGTYCAQYSMLEALEKVKPMSLNLFIKESMMKDFAIEDFGIKDVLISDVYIVQSMGAMESVVSTLSIDTDSIKNVQPLSKSNGTNSFTALTPESIANAAKEVGNRELVKDTLESKGNRLFSANPDVLEDSIAKGNIRITKGELSNVDGESKRSAQEAGENGIDPPFKDEVRVDKTTGRILLDEHFKGQYYQDMLLDSASKIVEKGKDQIDFILHNDDYISRWMRENEALKQQLIMFKRIMTAEESYIGIKYKKERTPEDDKKLGALDLELLEYEYLNRKKLLFYSNFNFQRAKKLIMDCYLSCHDTLRPIVQKYIDLADYMLSNDRVPMQVNSKDPLMLNGLPLRRKINAEFFASELYIRGWEICSGMRKTFGEYPIADLYKEDSLSLTGFGEDNRVKFGEEGEKGYTLKGYNSQRFFQKEFPVDSYNYLMQYVAHLPDTLKQAVFRTFKNPVIDEDAVFAENVKYPRGLIYVVQVGAFKRAIPVSFYKSFAPVVKEYKSEGVYRYTAGFFPKYNSALIALKQIKSLGYKDAFIVALQDGQRIPLPKVVKVR